MSSVPGPPTPPALGTLNSAPVADLQKLRALAHPLRAALLDAIRLYGPLTATQAAAQVDDSPSNCSFHLRTLAAAGLIEHAPSDDARSRPWRTVSGPLILEPGTTAETRSSFLAAMNMLHSRAYNDLLDWINREGDAPKVWRDAAFNMLSDIRMTADELAGVHAKIAAILEPFIADKSRKTPDPTGERQPVRMSLFAHPAKTAATTDKDELSRAIELETDHSSVENI